MTSRSLRLIAPMAVAACALSCAAMGLRQGERLDVAKLMQDHRANPVSTYARWEDRYVQVQGTVIEMGLMDQNLTSVDAMTIPLGNNAPALTVGKVNERVVQIAYVVIQTSSDPTRVKCILEPGWAQDLDGAQRGSFIRVSAHFVAIKDGPPTEVRIRECRVREIKPQ